MTGRNFCSIRASRADHHHFRAPGNDHGGVSDLSFRSQGTGFTAVEGIGAIRIVPTTEAKANAEVNMVGEPRGGERIMTHVLIVQHTSATQMIPLLRPLMSPTSQLSATIRPTH